MSGPASERPLDAVVVGAGPNGLAAAVAIAREGFSVHVVEAAEEIGGGTRTRQLTLPGLLHDVCSAVHPFALASPFLSGLGLESEGLVWRWAPVELAHPLDDGSAAVLRKDVARTAGGLGPDGGAWHELFAPLAARFGLLVDDFLRPVQHVPRHPAAMARFGPRALLPATVLARRWAEAPARAMFAGVAAHAYQPLERPTTAGIGLMLTAAAHAVGWPVAEGGSRSITDALAKRLHALGGSIETGRRVDALDELPPARVVLLDLMPAAAARVAGSRIPGRVARRLARFRHGPGAFKVDLAVEGGVPWTAQECGEAGTVHLGGTMEEIAATESAVQAGRMPERPFVLVSQQYVADPTRSNGDIHPLWAYAHVPSGYDGDATDAVLDQIERFAPGFRERVVARNVWRPRDLEAANPNYVGGDITGGANDPLQLVLRPRPALDPYRIGEQVFLCSAATPPGAGAHGMCGANAAASALRLLRR